MKMNMRKCLALLATLAMMLSVLPMGTLFASAADVNLIANGDFEGGTTHGWQTWGSTTVAVVTDDVASGSYSARVDVKDDWAPVTYTVSLKPNTDYVLTFKMKDNNSNGITVNLQKTDWSDVIVRLPVECNTAWAEYTKEFNSGSEDKLMFHFQSNCRASENHVFWLDDVVLVEKNGGSTPPAATGNLLTNGDFETGDATGWKTGNGATVGAEYGNGSYGVKLEDSPSWGCSLTVNGIAVEPDTDYILSFDYKGGTAGLYVQNNGVNILNEWPNSGSGWTAKEYTFNTGSYTSIDISFNGCETGTGVKYLDNIKLTKVGGDEPATGDEYHIDEDFEGGAMPDGWSVPAGGSTAVVADPTENDNKVLLISGTAWSEIVKAKTFPTDFDVIYTVSFRAKAKGNSADFNFQVKCCPQEDPGMGNSVVNETIQLTSEWKTYSFSFARPANNDRDFGGLIFVSLGSDFYVDDVKVKDNSSPNNPGGSTGNLITNGDFEIGDGYGWEINGTAEVTKEAAETGEYGVKLTGTGSWNDSVYTVFPVEPGKTYTLSYSIKTIEGGAATLFLLGGYENVAWKCGVELKGNQTLIKSSGDWQNMMHTIEPGDCTHVVVHINGGGGGTHYIDNIKVTENGNASSDGYITNGDFEINSGIGWSLEGTAKITEEAAETGSYGVSLTGTATWGDKAATVIAVEPGQLYTLTFSIKAIEGGPATLYLRGGMTENEWEANVVLPGDDVPINASMDWKKVTYCIDPGSCTYVVIHINGADGGTNYIDNVRVTKGWTAPSDPEKPTLTLSSFGVLNNRPLKESDNLLTNGSFETEGGQWDNATFLGDYVYVVDDETAPSGNKSLYFNTTGKTNAGWHVFWVDVEPGKDYVFSTWVKGAYISDDNRFAATVGVIDPDTRGFMIHSDSLFSSLTEQIVPPAWDNKWHLRSVSFNSGEKDKVGIALYGHSSQMWIDDMALYLIDAGVKYVGANAGGTVISKPKDADVGCAEENCLVIDPTFSSALSNDFWTTGGGWKNGFLSIEKNDHGYGTSLKYTESSKHNGLYYTKWIDVEPNTDYVFSVDMKVLKDGKARLVVMADKITGPYEFHHIDITSDVWGKNWVNSTITFNSDAFTRIGIAVVDKGGEALFDNIRLFKQSDEINMKDPYVGSSKNGWINEDGNWAFYDDGVKVINKWVKDSVGWCYLGADGYCVTDKWVADSIGWCYLDGNGRMVTNKWVKDSVGWCYVGADGYCVTDKWVADSIGWCYLDSSGRMATNKWVRDSVGWCYVGANGYCVTNKWVADSKGWCYLDAQGRMVTNKWVKDSVGWCYIGADGYCVVNDWVADSKGWCYLDENGRMVYDTYVDDYYVNADGYLV